MKKTTTNKKQLLYIGVLMLGASCSVKNTSKVIPVVPQGVIYKYDCSLTDGSIGIRDLSGALTLYKNNELLYSNHRGADLSFFITTQEPTTELPVLTAFALQNSDLNNLEYYALDLVVDLQSGLLDVTEEKYVRPTSADPWELDSRQNILHATTCKVL